MKKLLLSFLGLILLVACGSSSKIEYTTDRIVPTFNVALEKLKLGDYKFDEKNIKTSTIGESSLVIVNNNHFEMRLKVNKEQKIEAFEFVARGDFDSENFAKIIKLIKETFPNQDLYKIEEGATFGVKGIVIKLKK
jgi:hypothetical protein